MANNGGHILTRVVGAFKDAFNRNPTAFKVQALRFQQKEGRVNLYLTVLPVRQLLQQCRVDYFREDNPRGYQRPLTKGRLKQISAFIQHEEGILPISILLCIRQPHRAEFQPETLVDKVNAGVPQPGVLTIPQAVTLWVVDGQHRLYGLEYAFTKDSLELAQDYLLPVTIVEGIDSYEEMRHFHIINTRHKGVPTDMVDRHLLRMWELEGVAIAGKEGERSCLRARAAKLCDLLRNTPDSPWFQKVKVAGHKALPNQLIGQHTMVASLEPALKDAFIKRLGDEDVGKILLNYWYAVRERWASTCGRDCRPWFCRACRKPADTGSLRQRRYSSTSEGPPSDERAFSGNGGIKRGCGPSLPICYDVQGRQKFRSSLPNLRLRWSEVARPYLATSGPFVHWRLLSSVRVAVSAGSFPYSECRACIILLALRKISPVGKRAAAGLGEAAGDVRVLKGSPAA